MIARPCRTSSFQRFSVTMFPRRAPPSGELSQVTFPYGGYLRWSDASFTYSASTRTLREVQNRYL